MIKLFETNDFSPDLLEMPPVGPGFHAIPKEAKCLEIWETHGDPGPLCREFRLVDSNGHVLCTRYMYPKVVVLEGVRV